MTDRRRPLPSDCSVCEFPQWMHEEGESRQDCVYVRPTDELRKQRLLAIRAARTP